MELPHRTLEQLVLEQGRISAEDLRKVKRLQQERGERLERLLLDLGFTSEEDLLPLLAAFHGVDAVHRRDFPQFLAEQVQPPVGPRQQDARTGDALAQRRHQSLRVELLRHQVCLQVECAQGVRRRRADRRQLRPRQRAHIPAPRAQSAEEEVDAVNAGEHQPLIRPDALNRRVHLGIGRGG